MLFVVALGALGVSSCRSELSLARRLCGDIRPGVPRADAERHLAELHPHDLGGRLLGPGGPRTSYDYGLRGSLVSWECEVEIDATDHVTRTRFSPWLVIDLHGRWDDRASDWIERHWL